jgi:hypothetical protein
MGSKTSKSYAHAFHGVAPVATKSGDGRLDTSHCEFSLRFSQLDAEDALFGACQGAAESDAASGVPRTLPDAKRARWSNVSRSMSDALEWAAGDEGKGSPAYLEGEGGKAAGERMTFVAADTDEAK